MTLTKIVNGITIELTPDETAAIEAEWAANAAKPPKPPKSITRRQCALQLLSMGMISMAEAKAMTKDGTMPAAITAHLDGAVTQGSMTAEQRDLAEIDFAAGNYYRNNPLLALFGLTSQELDDFFIAAAPR